MERDEGNNVSIPRGGPIFVPKLTSSCISTPGFQCQITDELNQLKAALQLDSPFEDDEEDLSVDELRVFTDEELISEGMKEAFKDDGQSSQPEGSSSTGKESYLEKIEELAKIRQRQKEDRAAAQLHSLNHRNKGKRGAAISLENSERFKCLDSLRCPTKIKPSTTREHVSIRDQEVILCIEVYSNKISSLKTQEILVLGQQRLTELRDAIHCLTDVIMRETKQHDPSGYFLIEDTFFNDTRDPSAIDYSKPILYWLKNSKEEARKKWEHILNGERKASQKTLLGEEKETPHMPHFRAAKMQNIRFCDFEFHVGARYLYCHQGDCKHEIVIRDMRLVHPEDCQNRSAYPLVGFEHKFRVQKCNVCQVYKATCFTVDDKWAGENPCYFCDNCYYLLHYDGDGYVRYEYDFHKYIQDL